MRWMLAAALIALNCGAALALDCPPGAYPWYGRRGIEYCKNKIYDPPEGPAAKRGETCPAGTRATTDRQGVRFCKTVNSSSR